MRKILYICPKKHYDWDSLIPQQDPSSDKMDISILLLEEGIGLTDIPTTQVTALKGKGGEKVVPCPYEVISYQGFLEKVFLADLALVM